MSTAETGRLLSLVGCPSEILGSMSVVNSPCARFPLKSDRHVRVGGNLDAGYLDTIPDKYEREGFDRLSDKGAKNGGFYDKGKIPDDDAR